LIAREDGPFDLFSEIRGSIGQDSWIGRGLHCGLCVSFWLSLIPAIWLFRGMGSGLLAFSWLGIAGGVLVLYRMNDDQLT
jgi:hypothetical protein